MVIIPDGNPEIGAHVWSNIFIAFDLTERSDKSEFSSEKTHFPSHVRTIFWVNILCNYHEENVVSHFFCEIFQHIIMVDVCHMFFTIIK